MYIQFITLLFLLAHDALVPSQRGHTLTQAQKTALLEQQKRLNKVYKKQITELCSRKHIEESNICPICYCHREKLVVHWASHKNDKPFQCPNCPAKTKQAKSLISSGQCTFLKQQDVMDMETDDDDASAAISSTVSDPCLFTQAGLITTADLSNKPLKNDKAFFMPKASKAEFFLS